MRVVRGTACSKIHARGCVATIGNFDGVHLGHQMIINNLARHGRMLGLPVVVILFEPHPLEYFKQAEAPPRLTRLREKVTQLKSLPVDFVLVLRFTQQLANLEPEAFVHDYLVDGLAVRLLLVGDDFRFGKNRRGNFKQLKLLADDFGFKVIDSQTLLSDGQRISSTAIRHALQAGDLGKARQLLGRAYSVCGRVIHGDGRGRQLGFPTANMQLFRKKTPLNGVFAVSAAGIRAEPVPGVANVGTRPTVDGRQTVLLEVHLFDFDQDLYGRQIEIVFHHRLREERKFASLQELTAQIQNDVEQARQCMVV